MRVYSALESEKRLKKVWEDIRELFACYCENSTRLYTVNHATLPNYLNNIMHGNVLFRTHVQHKIAARQGKVRPGERVMLC